MFLYYAAPVSRMHRGLTVNPLSGSCILAATPHQAHIGLGLPKAGALFAVWLIGQADLPERPNVDLDAAGYLCSRIPPHRVYVCLDEDTIYPLAINAADEVQVEVGHAGAD